MRKTGFTALAVAAGLTTSATTAHAYNIPIVNNSFESPNITGVSPYYTTTNGVSGGIATPTIPGWTMTTTVGNIGVFAPAAYGAYTPPAGSQVGYIGGGNPSVVDPGSFSQDLGVSAHAGTTYELGVYVGRRGDGAYTLGDYTIALYAGTHLLDSVTDPVTPALGTFDLTGLTFTATALDSTYGDLTIVLSGGTSAGGTAYGQVAFDDVTLGTVPEASTWAMMALGFAGLGFAGYRRAKAAGALAA